VIFSHQDIFFLVGFAIGAWVALLTGPAWFETVARFFRIPSAAPSVTVTIGLDASAFRDAVLSAQSKIANLNSKIPQQEAAA
jgi:hypothetical protein